MTQTIGYGVLFYASSVLLTPIAVDRRTSSRQARPIRAGWRFAGPYPG